MPGHNLRFTVILDQEGDGGYSVYCPALPGCCSQGVDREEALAMIADAIQSVLEVVADNVGMNSALATLPVEETPEFLANEIREILEDRVNYGLPYSLELVEVSVPTRVAA